LVCPQFHAAAIGFRLPAFAAHGLAAGAFLSRGRRSGDACHDGRGCGEQEKGDDDGG